MYVRTSAKAKKTSCAISVLPLRLFSIFDPRVFEMFHHSFSFQSVFGTLPRRKLLILTLAHTMKRLFLPSASVASSMKLIEEVNSSLLNANNRFISKTVSRPYSAATLWVMLPTRNDK